MLPRTQWYLPRQYPVHRGTYEGQVQVWVRGEAAAPIYEGLRPIRQPQYIQQFARVFFDGFDWDMPEDWVLIEWRGLTEDPLHDL